MAIVAVKPLNKRSPPTLPLLLSLFLSSAKEMTYLSVGSSSYRLQKERLCLDNKLRNPILARPPIRIRESQTNKDVLSLHHQTGAPRRQYDLQILGCGLVGNI